MRRCGGFAVWDPVGVSAGMTVIARQGERFPMDQSKAHYFVKQLPEILAILAQLG